MKAESAAQARYALTVVDTNVLLSAALSPGGTPALLVDRLLETGKLVFSTATFAELETRLWQPKFDRYLSMEKRRQLLQQAHGAALWIDIPAALAQRTYCRDPDDDKFIALALAAQATRLITGDAALNANIVLPRLVADGSHWPQREQAAEHLIIEGDTPEAIDALTDWRNSTGIGRLAICHPRHDTLATALAAHGIATNCYSLLEALERGQGGWA